MTLSVYLIAGEPSGDRLGGALMRGLIELEEVAFHGVGGRDMQSAGLTSLFEMSDLTVMGISEVLPRLPLILRRIRETSDDVIARRPDVLITVDAPDFSLRVANRVKRALPDLKTVHYVAPSVWAWRPGRAAKMARHVDHVLALLPFEPPYMEAAGMTCDFVGHPIAVRPVPQPPEVQAFRQRFELDAERKTLLLAPGSRGGEVRRFGADLRGAVEILRTRDPGLQIVCPVAETVRDAVTELVSGLDPAVLMITPEMGDEEKTLAFAAADAALCASGTVTLEVAAARTPMVAAYRVSWLTAQIVRRVSRVNTANLINLVSGRSIVPEFLQEFCTPEALANAVEPLLSGSAEADHQLEVFDDVLAALGRGGQPPGQRAAESVLSVLNGTRKPSDELSKVPDAAPGPHARHEGRRG